MMRYETPNKNEKERFYSQSARETVNKILHLQESN